MQMSGPASNPQWYLARDGQQFGPISDAEMAKLVELGHLKPTDLLWREGFPDWRPAMVVFPAHAPPLSRGPRLTQRADPGRLPAADSLAAPVPQERTGHVEGADERRPGVLGRVVRLVLLVAVMAAAAGAAYLYRAPLTGLAASLMARSGPAIADRRSLETPPLAGFRAGTAAAIDATLQATALWKVVKREFPDWYNQRIAEAAQLAREGKDDAVIGQLMARKLVELRRQQVASGLSATPETLRTVATAYHDSLTRLRSYSPEACSGFIKHGEAEPLIVALLQGSEHTAHLQAQLTAIFEAIAEGRQLPRVHPRPTREQHQMLASELVKRGWTEDDFKLLSSDQAMAQAAPVKVCQLVHDYFAAQLSLPDQEAQLRLLVIALRLVLTAG
jgi:hypothetical protein